MELQHHSDTDSGWEWRAALERRVSCQWDFTQLFPHGLFPAACSQVGATAHLSWPGVLAAKPQRGKMILEAVRAPRSVCTCVTTQGTGLKRRPLHKNYELRHPNGAERSKWSVDIQTATCHLELWMHLQIGSVFVNQYMQCC